MPIAPNDNAVARRVAGPIKKLIRLENSRDGNPRWKLYIGDSVFITKADSQVGFAIEGHHEGYWVNIGINNDGRIVDYVW